MKIRQASCSCGAVRVSARGEPVRISICHCLACQRRTGSVFAAQARFARTEVSIDGLARDYVRIGDSGDAMRFRFCSHCGATVCYSLDADPDLIAIPVGAFADPDFPPPQVSVYEARRHAWVGLPDGIEHID